VLTTSYSTTPDKIPLALHFAHAVIVKAIVVAMWKPGL
jgi:hypothetical protein